MPNTHSSNPVLHLPNELLATIINELASDNDETLTALASCRLASRVLCSYATPLFFSSIHLTDSTNYADCSLLRERATKLNQILTIHDIAASVHTLALRCHRESLKNSINGTLISTILSRLPHVRNFSLEAVRKRKYLLFSLIPEKVALAIRALCRSPNLTTLYLNNVDGFPFMDIIACPNLRCLRLRNVTRFQLNDINSSDEISSPQLLYLDSLEIDLVGTAALGQRISEDMSIRKHFSRIKKLQLGDFFSDVANLTYGWDILLLASQTLTTLDLPEGQYRTDPCTVDPEQVLDSVPFDLGRFPALRHFKIHRRSPCQNSLANIRFLTRLLSISSFSSGIETLEIEIIWQSVMDGHGKDLFSADAGWSTLDQLLTSVTFGSLSKVVLRLGLEMVMDSSSESDFCNDLPYVNDLFPLFRASTNAHRTLETHLDVKVV